ncbi:hypothetical protein MIMGU_mgv1a020683mg [Erythranthe guttata]|uniref:BSD domain-containing protein n=1 Tax=Erythranthe guttata TaxID=4155 RepID=A0A022PPJ7_ERYGU|nr:hypothetical protein MIMGU_mgv1a020683mg [Erythranthe guttata]
MSSWIPSLFNPFSDDDDHPTTAPSQTTPQTPSSGAKDDLSAVFRGVAAFLAPPQAVSLSGPSSSSSSSSSSETIGSFRSGLSLISSKFTSNLLQFQSQLDENDEVEEEEVEVDEDAVGINEEVLDFVEKISARPELWTDFPLSLPDDFDLSDYQREHAANIEDLIPDFVTLRQKICSQMSNAKFWLIYFILLLPRLNEEDLELLSTPQVAEARETLLKKLHNKTDVDQETAANEESSDTNKEIGKGYSTEGEGGETISHPKDASAPNPTKQKAIASQTESSHHYEEIDTRRFSDPQTQPENEEDDVSFSDLEDDDNDLSDNLSGPKSSKSDKGLVPLDENIDAKQKADQSSLRDKESEI